MASDDFCAALGQVYAPNDEAPYFDKTVCHQVTDMQPLIATEQHYPFGAKS